jgi:hypothetical protein
MSQGCTSPYAANYDPTATQDDGSCVFLLKHAGNCFKFTDAPAQQDKSFTLSYSLHYKAWVFFHDWNGTPDMYMHTRKQLYTLQNGSIYQHNAGNPGQFYDGVIKPFFIDVVFTDKQEMTLNALKWVTEVLTSSQELEFSTLTHITIWNNQQCTGRTAISDIFDSLTYQVRKTESVWSFDDFKDQVTTRGTQFLADIFSNFAVDASQLGEKPWYDQGPIEGSWFIVRLEFDNQSGNQIVLHDVDVSVDKSYR